MRYAPLALFQPFATHSTSGSSDESALAAIQHELLVDSGIAVSWAQTLKEVPDGPAIVIGNEFLDVLPGANSCA